MNPDGLGKQLPTLRGDGVLLRSLTEHDAAAVFDLFSDSDVVRFMSLRQLATRSDATDLIADIHRHFLAGTLYQWGIERDRQIVGTCTLAGIDRRHRRAELGFAVLKRVWGQRILSRSLPVLIAFAFERLVLHRLEADVEPSNVRSMRALQSAGFRREGLLRERYIQHGEAQDAIVFGLLEKEWRGNV